MDYKEAKKILLELKKLPEALKVKTDDLDGKGIYCIKIKDKERLRTDINKEFIDYFINIFNKKPYNVLYIGVARIKSSTLFKRLHKQELNNKGPATFFRTIGLILGFIPDRHPSDKNRLFKYSKVDKMKIINWINENIEVSYIKLEEKDFYDKENEIDWEKELIRDIKPLLNIMHSDSEIAELLTDIRTIASDFNNSKIRTDDEKDMVRSNILNKITEYKNLNSW